ncbi:MAG: bifunctional nuclease family protein [Chloroflexota bacterium]
MGNMVEVMIDSIRVSLISQQRIVILREIDTERYLAIWIGIYEADAIQIALQDVEIARPLTWDLLRNVMVDLGAHVVRVEVVALRDDTFYGNIVLETDGRLINIDSRPSDALALAVRARVPIMVSRAVMDTAGITPEEDLQAKAANAAASGEAPSEERLSVFEDFLESLDIGSESAPDTGDDDDLPPSER